MSFSYDYINETVNVLSKIDYIEIDKIAEQLREVRGRDGRLFILGVGGSAGTASHAVNDFRKICNIETYTPVDNVSELTALTNDLGWQNCFEVWLHESRLQSKDALLILSVGGGNKEKNISVNLINAIDFAKEQGAYICGVVGKDGGYTKEQANNCIIIPPLFNERITPHTEGLCSVILHLLVSHPILKVNQTTWESVK